MASLEDLEARVAALEDTVQKIREDAAAARVLAGGADRDVAAFDAKLRAHTTVLNALRETQLEHGETLREHGEALRQHGETLRQHGEAIVALDRKMTEGFITLNTGMTRIAAVLERLAGPEHDSDQ
jgi:chromosome segregation ATPase